MNSVKYNKGSQVSQKSITVEPPKGYHWMEERGRYFLMKGDYKLTLGLLQNKIQTRKPRIMKSKKDACYNKVKARYSVWPSYASGALAKCRGGRRC